MLKSGLGSGMLQSQRFQMVDVLRGVAIVLMIAYHFCYDLNFYGFTDFHFSSHPFWLGMRALILSMFLSLVGVSLVLATSRGIRWSSYLRRLGLLLASALLITLISHLMFPGRIIVFGILHFIVVASILGLLFVRLGWFNLALGGGLVVLGVFYQHPVFDQGLFHWIGMMTHKPQTEDYVPFLPWFGVVVLGMLGGWLLAGRHAPSAITQWRGDGVVIRGLSLAGRHGLMIYMLHQPLLLTLLWPVAYLARG